MFGFLWHFGGGDGFCGLGLGLRQRLFSGFRHGCGDLRQRQRGHCGSLGLGGRLRLGLLGLRRSRGRGGRSLGLVGLDGGLLRLLEGGRGLLGLGQGEVLPCCFGVFAGERQQQGDGGDQRDTGGDTAHAPQTAHTQAVLYLLVEPFIGLGSIVLQVHIFSVYYLSLMVHYYRVRYVRSCALARQSAERTLEGCIFSSWATSSML